MAMFVLVSKLRLLGLNTSKLVAQKSKTFRRAQTAVEDDAAEKQLEILKRKAVSQSEKQRCVYPSRFA